MANGTNKGGKSRGEAINTTTASFECPICGAMNTKRKSFEVRGARFCKVHGNEQIVLGVISHRAKKKARMVA
jgi:hypothetical protein